MKKRLLIVMEAIQVNGAVKGWLGYLDAIDRKDWGIDVFLFDPDKHDGIILPSDVNQLPPDIHCVVERVGYWRALGYVLPRLRLDLIIKRTIYSILHYTKSPIRKWDLIKAAKRLPMHYDVAIASSQGVSWEYVATKVSADKKFLWVDTDIRAAYWQPFWNRYKKFIDMCSGVVCVSKSMRDQMRIDNPQWADKIFAMNYVVDEEGIIQKGNEHCPYPKTGRMRLVTVGRYSPEKGQYMIPAMAQKLKEKGYDFEWYVIAPGSGTQRAAIDRELVERGVTENVIVNDGMKNPFPVVKFSDISVQPSAFEGFGLTVSEAMILGAYVVASDIPTFREQIPDDSCGCFAKKLDVDSFVEAIEAGIKTVRSGGNCKDFKTPYSKAGTYRQFMEIVETAK